MPRSLRVLGFLFGSRIQIVRLSPLEVEVLASRSLKILWMIRASTVQSWGFRFSAISISVRTLGLETSLVPLVFSGVQKSPSIHGRMMVPFSFGSIWISLALSVTADSRRVSVRERMGCFLCPLRLYGLLFLTNIFFLIPFGENRGLSLNLMVFSFPFSGRSNSIFPLSVTRSSSGEAPGCLQILVPGEHFGDYFEGNSV